MRWENIGVPYKRIFQMRRIKELLFIRNEDNKIEIDAEIYNILVSENIKEEENYGKSKTTVGTGTS